MELNIIIDYLIISIMASLAINSVLRNFAKEKKLLVDIPDRSRKFHKRATPLTGGIGILLAVIISTEIYLDMNNLKGYIPEFSQKLYIASIPLLLLFLIDDFKALRPFYRLIVQIALSLYVIFSTEKYKKPLLAASEHIANAYVLPKTLDKNDFMEWLQNSRVYDSEFQFNRITLTVSK